jgi:hypothetical protein
MFYRTRAAVTRHDTPHPAIGRADHELAVMIAPRSTFGAARKLASA